MTTEQASYWFLKVVLIIYFKRVATDVISQFALFSQYLSDVFQNNVIGCWIRSARTQMWKFQAIDERNYMCSRQSKCRLERLSVLMKLAEETVVEKLMNITLLVVFWTGQETGKLPYMNKRNWLSKYAFARWESFVHFWKTSKLIKKYKFLNLWTLSSWLLPQRDPFRKVFWIWGMTRPLKIVR